MEHLLLSGKSTRMIVQEPGVNFQSLQKWKEKFKALSAGQVAGTLEALQAENRRLYRAVQQRDILKKPWHPLGTRGERFVRIAVMAVEHDIVELCAVPGVSRSGCHAWKGRKPRAPAGQCGALDAHRAGP